MFLGVCVVTEVKGGLLTENRPAKASVLTQLSCLVVGNGGLGN